MPVIMHREYAVETIVREDQRAALKRVRSGF